MDWGSGWVDAHCHLTDDRIWSDSSRIQAECKAVGITGWVLAGYSPADWQRQKQLLAALPHQIVASFGLHPWWVCEQDEAILEGALELLGEQLQTVPLLGETGLDYARDRKPLADKQKRLFERQLKLARHHGKPVALHIVRAHEDAMNLLQKWAPLTGWVHSFSGSVEQAKRYMDMGLCISLGGSALSLAVDKRMQLLEAIADDKLLVETDAPDQTPRLPEFAQAAFNHPRNLVAIAHRIAEFSGKQGVRLLENSRKNLERILK